MEIRNKVAIVTGGNGGLGQRICHSLAAAGCHVVVVYAQSRMDARKVADELKQKGVEAEAMQCDIAVSEDINTLISTVLDRFGRIDMLINDAAFNKWIPFNDLDNLTHEIWNKILNINLTGPLLLIKAAAPAMKKQGSGRIVNISSIAGLAPSGSSIAYAVSKAGLNHLTKCMAVALAPDILINCIAPGYLEGTRATANLDPAQYARAMEASLLKRPADKDDIADQVVALCRTDSITGQTLVIDSGRFFH